MDWLVARPIAHRGLHDAAAGRVENSRAAASAAIEAGCAIECDVQISADGEAMVFHDERLDRLTDESGALAACESRRLTAIALRGGGETIPTFAEFLALVGGRVPVICEIKSAFDDDMRLAERAARIAADHAGPVAFKSFDPAIVAHLRAHAERLRIGHVPLGLVAEARYDAQDWSRPSEAQRREMETLTHWPRTRPDFISWRVGDLPHAAPILCRAMNLPVMTWTVRTPAQLALARAHADQIVFEGFRPYA